MDGNNLKKRSLVILIKEILDQLDEAADLTAKGNRANVSKLLLREMCAVLQELEPELLELYFEVLPTLASATPPPPVSRRFSEEKSILSEPVKRRFVQRIRDELAKNAA